MNQFESVLYYIGDNKYDKSIAFDLDNTLITTKSGKKFPINFEDFKWINLQKLQTLDQNIIIFTNQSKMPSDFFKKIQLMLKDINFSIFISTQHDEYRKPHIGMYELYTKLIKHPITQYIGDAAGRTTDFSACDKNFAHNAKILFKLPEEFYEIQHKSVYLPTFYDNIPNYEQTPIPQHDNLYVIFTCRLPASDKSSYVKQLKIPVISQDECGSKAKTIKVVKNAIADKKSFVIDKLFCTIQERKEYLELFPPEYKKICYDFTDYDKDGQLTKLYIDRCKHLNEYRAFVLKISKYIPDIVYNVQIKNFKPPNIEFDEIHVIKLNIPIIGRYID